MKPCWKNRKRLSWLVLGELEPQEARELHLHLGNCPGCRRRFEELSDIKRALTPAEPGLEGKISTGFHRRFMGALRKKAAPAPPLLWTRPLHGWRTALAFGLLVAAAALLWPWPARTPRLGPAADPGPLASTPAPAAQRELPAPTIANYLHAAEGSLDALDDLLTEQARRSAPATPIFTATTSAFVAFSRTPSAHDH